MGKSKWLTNDNKSDKQILREQILGNAFSRLHIAFWSCHLTLNVQHLVLNWSLNATAPNCGHATTIAARGIGSQG